MLLRPRALRARLVNLADRAYAALVVHVLRRDVAGCGDCGAASVRLFTWGPAAQHGLDATLWARCTYCTDRLLSDEDAVEGFARHGCTWVVIPRPVFKAECAEALAYSLYPHRLPFLVAA